MLLGIKTDTPIAEFYLADDHGNVAYKTTWEANRELAHGLLKRLDLFTRNSGTSLATLTGLFVFRGPGSYTGLRIGITVMNTLAYSQQIPIIGTDGVDWLAKAVSQLLDTKNDQVVLPLYGSDVNITSPRK